MRADLRSRFAPLYCRPRERDLLMFTNHNHGCICGALQTLARENAILMIFTSHDDFGSLTPCACCPFAGPLCVETKFHQREKMSKRKADMTVAPTSFLWNAYYPNRYYYEVDACFFHFFFILFNRKTSDTTITIIRIDSTWYSKVLLPVVQESPTVSDVWNAINLLPSASITSPP